MAQMVLGTAGAAIGGYFGGPVGAQLGFMIGSAIGGMIDKPKGRKTPPSIVDNTVNDAQLGTPIGRGWGQFAVQNCTRMWQKKIRAVVTEQSAGGKGGAAGGGASTSTVSYFGTAAWGVCEGPIQRFGRIWANGKVIVNADGTGKYGAYFTYYYGTETQEADPTIEAEQGAGNVPGFRGLAYIVCADLPLADFGNMYPQLKVEVVTANAGLTYDPNFEWSSDYVAAPSGVQGPFRSYGYQQDKYGNLILSEATGGVRVIAWAPDGTVAWELQTVDIADAVDSFAGSAVVDRSSGVFFDANSNLHMAAIVNGEYLIANFQANYFGSSSSWHVILEPQPSGPPEVRGAVFHNGLGKAPSPAQPFVYMESGQKTATDPLLVLGEGPVTTAHLVVLPSALEIIGGRYNVGHPDTPEPFHIPYAKRYPLGSADLSTNLYNNSAPFAYVHGGGFTLPSGIGSSTDLYLYFNKAYLDFNVSGALTANPEIRDVIQPAYPDGAMVKIPLGLLDYETIVNAGGTVSAAGYTVDNANWVTAAGEPVLPFDDEYTYLSTGAVGGNDAYQMKPAMVEGQPDGSWLIGFTMPGIDDASANLNDEALWMAVRLFHFNPLLGTFTELGHEKGLLYTDQENLNGAQDFLDQEQTLTIENGQIYVLGYIDQVHAAYKARFGTPNLSGFELLSTIVGDVCDACGLVAGTDFDVSALASQQVRGYFVAREASGRSIIESLQQVYFFDGVDSDGKLKFQFRGGTPIDEIDEDDLGARAAGEAPKPLVDERPPDEEDLTRQVTIKFLDVAMDYQQNAVSSRRLATAVNCRDEMTVEVAIVMSVDDANAIAERALYLIWIMGVTFEISLPPGYLVYDPGDVLTLVYGEGTVTVPIYITDLSYGGDQVVLVKALRTDAEAYLPSPSRGAGSGYVPPDDAFGGGATTLILGDWPLLRDDDDAPGFYWGIRGANSRWAGGQAYRSTDGVNYAALGGSTIAVVTGEAMSALPNHTNRVIDRTNILRVIIDADASLTSVTELDMLNGANAAMLGDELIGFATATLVSTITNPDGTAQRMYDLTTLLRGRQGTSWAAAGHDFDDRFVLLADDGAIRTFGAALTDRNVENSYKGVAFGGSIASADAQVFTPALVRLKPIAPVNLRGARDDYGNLNITFDPCARVNNEMLDGIETGNDEDVEAYEIEVYDGVTLKRTEQFYKPAFFYSAENQTTDFGAPESDIAVVIYQLSTRVGRGYPASATL